MSIIIDGGAGITFPDTVQQTNAMTMTGGNPLYYAARAWVNFDGTGSVFIRAAANVSSVTDFGLGTYRVNFSAAMPDANYVPSVCCAGGDESIFVYLDADVPSPYSTTQFQLEFRDSNDLTALTDVIYAWAVFFR